MSVISLHYGQCGNQICKSLFMNIHKDISSNRKDTEYCAPALNKWFNVGKKNKWEPRSVLVDTENKTIPCNKHMPYQFQNVVSKSYGGSANNWAFGYFEHSKLLKSDILECVRKELEKCDFLSSFLNVFSSSGGTGSGVGSYVIECLKDQFPTKTVTNVIVLPYSAGEVVTQSYNTVLTLSKLYPISDAILIFENDRLHYNCTNSLSLKDVDFDDINNLIAQQLLSVYQPLKNAHAPELLLKLCENSLYKLLQLQSAPLSNLEYPSNWKSLLTSLSRRSRFDLQQKDFHKLRIRAKNFSTALISRGVHKPDETDLKSFKDSFRSKGQPQQDSRQIYHHQKKIFDIDNYLTVVSNGNNVCNALNVILQDARRLHTFGAYLHHYEKFGVDETYFLDCFEHTSKIIDDYKTL